MDVAKYTELTGIEVDSSETALVTAQIRRTRVTLESMLGYSLLKSKAGINQYEEKGKTKTDCIFRGLLSDIDFDDLDPADDVEGSYRLFPYNKADKFFEVDPFTKLYKVKLVFVKAGDEPNGVTHKTFSDSNIRVHKQGTFSKYIERCEECLCTCLCDNCVQLAVEADWLNEDCVPEDLQMVWVDMIEYNVDPKGDIVSETLGTHSYKRELGASPETLADNISVIKKYAGPNGSVNKTIVV